MPFIKDNMDLVLATGNKNKVKEFQIIFKNVKIHAISEFIDTKFEVNENGKTFRRNSYLKAKAASKLTDFAVFADDSGIVIPALPHILGVYSSRFMGEDTSYDIKANEILRLLKDKKRNAYYECCITYIKGHKVKQFVGKCKGKIAYEIQKGDGGFGYDIIFIPNGYDKTFSVLSDEIKCNIGHRAIATNKLKKYLKED